MLLDKIFENLEDLFREFFWSFEVVWDLVDLECYLEDYSGAKFLYMFFERGIDMIWVEKAFNLSYQIRFQPDFVGDKWDFQIKDMNLERDRHSSIVF